MSRTPLEADAQTTTIVSGDFIDFTDISNNNAQGKTTLQNFSNALNVGTLIGSTQTLRCTTQLDKTDTTLTNITGLTGIVVGVGTYKFRYFLNTTCGGTGGTKVAFKLNTAVLGVIDYTTLGYTASAVAVAKGTTTTDQTPQIASNTAAITVIGEGTFTVTTAGTIDLQFAENSANSTSSVQIGSTFEVKRLA